MKEQIEEMKIDVLESIAWKDIDDDVTALDIDSTTEHLRSKGYRKQEWISVDERLPENVYGKDRKKINVIVCTESGKVSTASRQRIVKWDKTKLEYVLDTFEWSKSKRVTHWMPLPEPPKMKGDAE